jgi:hypothetical protein
MTTAALVELLNAGDQLAEAAAQNWDDRYKDAAIRRWRTAAAAVSAEMADDEAEAEVRS